jgi:hypothetical protein
MGRACSTQGKKRNVLRFRWDAAAYMHPFFVKDRCNMFSLKTVHTPLTAWELLRVGKKRHKQKRRFPGAL